MKNVSGFVDLIGLLIFLASYSNIVSPKQLIDIYIYIFLLLNFSSFIGRGKAFLIEVVYVAYLQL